MPQFPYRRIVGALNYLTCLLRPEIAFATNYLARFMDNPGIQRWDTLLNVLAYSRDHPYATITYYTPSYRTYETDGQLFHMQPNTFYSFVDADDGKSDMDHFRSVTGYVIYLFQWSAYFMEEHAAKNYL